VFISAEKHDRLADLLPFTATRYRADRMQAVVYRMPSMKT